MIVLGGSSMIKIQYVGPRVDIYQYGMVYKTHKEDKYIYLMAAFKMLKSIDNDYEKQDSYVQYANEVLTTGEMDKILEKYKDIIEKKRAKYENKLEQRIDYISQLSMLSPLEKEAWIHNIQRMKTYLINRAVNKMYYFQVIQELVHLIQHKRIKEIRVPLNKIFFHVFNTLKGALITDKKSLDVSIAAKSNEDGSMLLKMSIT